MVGLALDIQHDQPAHHQRHDHHARVIEHRLDGLDEDRADDCRRQERDDQVAGERDLARHAGQRAAYQLKQPRAEYPHHRQDRAKLDHHLEHFAIAGLEIDPVAHQDKVAGAGHGNELGQAFKNAEDEGLDQVERVISHVG
ncbi:hypothetical protein D3C71_1291000 [compost metagenome]